MCQSSQKLEILCICRDKTGSPCLTLFLVNCMCQPSQKLEILCICRDKTGSPCLTLFLVNCYNYSTRSLKAHPHCNLNPGWTRVELGLCVSALNSLSMNPSRTRVEANPHSDVYWSEFNPGWRKCGFHISDVYMRVHVPVLCMRIVKKWQEDSNESTPWRLGRSQCVQLAYDHLKTLPRFPCPLLFSLCIFNDLWSSLTDCQCDG